MLSKNWEAYSEIAKRLGDTVIITDEEMYNVAAALSIKNYGIKNPGILNPNQKLELAKQLKQDYYASNKQIKNILKLDINVINELFG